MANVKSPPNCLQALSTPVYALSTRGAPSPTAPSPASISLVTYCSYVSRSPHTVLAVGLFKGRGGTLTRENFLRERTAVLQILSQSHASLFDLLGKTSGRDVDKKAALADLGVAFSDQDGHVVLEQTFGWATIELLGTPTDCGDHDVALCRVVEASQALNKGVYLTTGMLREAGYMESVRRDSVPLLN